MHGHYNVHLALSIRINKDLSLIYNWRIFVGQGIVQID